MSLRQLLKDYYRKSIGLVEVSDQPYATHMPILTQLAQQVKPRRIAEFGMGHFSTSVFLDRSIFPSLELLTSFEDDPEWFSIMAQKHSPDSRLEANLVSPPMWKAALRLRASDYDLIFVDDSKSARERSRTLLALRLSKGVTRRPVVVVHDVDLPRLRAATLIFPSRKYFRDFCPQTGVLCWESRLEHHMAATNIESRR